MEVFGGFLDVAALDGLRQSTEVKQDTFVEEGVGAFGEGLAVKSGIHADGIAGTSFDAETAGDAPQLVNDELGGVLFDFRVVVLSGSNVYAIGRAGCRTTHAGDTPDGSIIPFHQSMKASVSRRVLDLLLRILNREKVFLGEDVSEQLACGDGQPSEDFPEIEPIEPRAFRAGKDFGGCHRCRP